MTAWTRRVAVVTAMAALIGLLSSCAIEGSHGSRHEIYNSVSEMLEYSSDVVVGTVSKQDVVEDGDFGDMTLVTFDVAEVYAPAGTGKRWADENVPIGTVLPGHTITIRQHGAPHYSEAPAPFLEPGTGYLLFLNPAGLDGDAGTHFTIVGVVAGIYVDDGSNSFTAITATEAFRSSNPDGPVDSLPQTIDPATQLK